MANWGEGYVTDINYTNGFYRELAPVWLATTATLLGFQPPRLDQPYAYAELGCGQGFGTNLLAAANPQGRFWGFDFNPAQISHARRLAEATGLANIEFHDLSFQELAASADDAWPAFDFITLHGIYSWVSRDNQLAMQTFIRRFLKPGGLVYISYNCAPGKASTVPLQHLMRLHADKHPARSDAQGRAALDFVQRLWEGGASFFNFHGDLQSWYDVANKTDSHYVPHEYLNRAWHVINFADMADDCTQSKLAYLGSANLVENVESLSVPAAMQALLAAENDPVLRQTILDFASNKGFRRDIYQKGLATLTHQEQLDAIKRIRLVPINLPESGEMVIRTPIGEGRGHPDLYGPLLQALAAGEMSMAEIAARPEMTGKNVAELCEVALLLMDAGYVHPALEAVPPFPAQGFNRAVCRAVMDGHYYCFLAAPKLGTGMLAGFADMLGIGQLIDEPDLDEAGFVAAAWRVLEQKQRRLIKEGVMLESLDASAGELKAIYAALTGDSGFPWRRLGVL
jgi:SAM-dependent methyltransferase